MIRFRQQYTDPEDDQYLADLCAIDCSVEPDKTLQQYKDEVNINTMIRRFGVTGQPPGAPARQPFYGDFSGLQDFQASLNAVRDAERQFMALPADLRKRFANDPGLLLEFVSDSSNYDEAVKLGLVPAPPAPSASTVPVAELPAS